MNWFIVGVFFVVLEIVTPGIFFVLFGISAIVVALAVQLGLQSFVAQLVLFLVVSVILLIFIRPLANLTTKEPDRKANVDRLVGKDAIVLQAITGDGLGGLVKVEGEEWRAVSQDKDIIEKGARVKILSVDSNKLIVMKEEEK